MRAQDVYVFVRSPERDPLSGLDLGQRAISRDLDIHALFPGLAEPSHAQECYVVG
jgi:hypothetical protein